jgi:hypothetical protein
MPVMFRTQKVTQLPYCLYQCHENKQSQAEIHRKKLHENPPPHCGIQKDSYNGIKEQKHGNEVKNNLINTRSYLTS